MEIVDYSTPRRGEDLSNPNVTRSTAIVADTPRSQIVEERIFITERRQNILLASDEQVDVINLVEAGEIVSIEVVSDNPYTRVYLEMDDYKNQEPGGVSAAELLARGRDEYSEREFYAEDRQKDGSYVVKYHPRKTDAYTDKLRIIVRNGLRSSDLYGNLFGAQELQMRNDLPSPSTINFTSGGSLRSNDFKVLRDMGTDLFSNAIVRHHSGYQVSGPNLAVLKDPRLKTAPFNPFIGEAGKISITQVQHDGTTNPYVVFGEPGDETRLPNGETPPGGASTNFFPWPGFYVNDAWQGSRQWIVIYGSTAESFATGINMGAAGSVADFAVATDRIVFRKDDTLYFPGRVEEAYMYNTGGAAWIDLNTGTYDPSTHGAVAYLVGHGLNTKPASFQLTPTAEATNEGVGSFGTLTEARTKPHVFIREIIVRRVRRKYLNG